MIRGDLRGPPKGGRRGRRIGLTGAAPQHFECRAALLGQTIALRLVDREAREPGGLADLSVAEGYICGDRRCPGIRRPAGPFEVAVCPPPATGRNGRLGKLEAQLGMPVSRHLPEGRVPCRERGVHPARQGLDPDALGSETGLVRCKPCRVLELLVSSAQGSYRDRPPGEVGQQMCRAGSVSCCHEELYRCGQVVRRGAGPARPRDEGLGSSPGQHTLVAGPDHGQDSIPDQPVTPTEPAGRPSRHQKVTVGSGTQSLEHGVLVQRGHQRKQRPVDLTAEYGGGVDDPALIVGQRS